MRYSRSEGADQLPDVGDLAGAETWHRTLNAIERLQAKAPEVLSDQSGAEVPLITA